MPFWLRRIVFAVGVGVVVGAVAALLVGPVRGVGSIGMTILPAWT